jgi:hypothetical protein
MDGSGTLLYPSLRNRTVQIHHSLALVGMIDLALVAKSSPENKERFSRFTFHEDPAIAVVIPDLVFIDVFQSISCLCDTQEGPNPEHLSADRSLCACQRHHPSCIMMVNPHA